MAEQKRRAESQDEKARPQELQQEEAAREAARQAAFAASGGGPLGPPDDISIQAVAARLGDRRFQTAQRQAMAARIRRVSGNQFLQRAVAQARRQEPVGDTRSAWAQQAAVEEDAEGTPESTAADQRAALRPVAGDVVSPAPVSTESRFAHDSSRVPAHTVSPQAGEKEEQTAQPKAGGGLIQRRDGPSEPQQFIPSTSADPDTASLRIFEHHIHSWMIDNHEDAPENTRIRWGWALDVDDVLELIGDDSQDAGATKMIWVQAQKPGETRIQGTPTHQVPGGPEVVGDTQFANVTVQEPTLEKLSTMPRRADGSGARSDHLSAGDKLIVRVKVGNVDGEHMEDPTSTTLRGQGLDLASLGTTTPVQQFADGKSYDVEIIANTPGSLNLELELGIGNITLGRGPSVSDITGEIEMDRQEFINLCNQCDTKISRAYTRANSIMEVLSAAYGSAYEGHQDTLTAQSASNQLAERIILSAALAFIPGGVGGVVGNMMQNAAVGNFLAGAITDMAKAGAAGLQTAVAPGGGGGGAPMRAMGANPRTWRAQYVVRVNTEKEHVLDILDNWKTKANASDPDFYLNFNPVTVTEQSLVQNGQPLKDMPVPDQAEHERLFELGFWREWLQTYAYTVEATPSYRGVRYTTRENQGKKIRDRINALGENGDEWLERYGGVARRRAEAERERRNR